MIFKNASSVDFLMEEMSKNLIKNAQDLSSHDHISKAIDLLDEAAKIFETAGMPQFSDQIVDVLTEIVSHDANLNDQLNAKDKFKNKHVCPVCHKKHNDKTDCDYEQCGYCGFDHSYEPEEAAKWHLENDPDGDIYK